MRKRNIILICLGVPVLLVLAGWAFVSLVGLIFKNGFGPGLADYTYRIPNTECLLYETSAHNVGLSCYDIKKEDGENKGINPKIKSIGWNDQYIIAITNPVTKEERPGNSYMIPDKSITYWWIIDLINNDIHGQIDSEEEFVRLKTQLGIGDIDLVSVDKALDRSEWINGDFVSDSIEHFQKHKYSYGYIIRTPETLYFSKSWYSDSTESKIWIENDDLVKELSWERDYNDTLNYSKVRIEGDIKGPGQYGNSGQYPYSIYLKKVEQADFLQ